MSKFHRRTAPGVKGGRVQKQNNGRPTPTCYNTPQATPAIDRVRPGKGYHHLLCKRDVARFVALLPNWGELSRGLDVILLDQGREDCDGWYDRGVLAVCAWDEEMDWDLDPYWYADHRHFLARIGADITEADEDTITCRWTRETARAYQLLHVFLHELGHHVDRMCTRSRREPARGEDYAEDHAWLAEAEVWERYGAEFGVLGGFSV